MNQAVRLSLFVLLLSFSHFVCAQRDSTSAEQSIHATLVHASRVPLYQLDKTSLQASLSYILDENPHVIGLQVYEKEMDTFFLSYYKDADLAIFNQNLPVWVKNYASEKLKIDYLGEDIGYIEVFYDAAILAAKSLHLSTDEVQYLKSRPELNIVLEDLAPLASLDKNNKPSGILVDYLESLFEGSSIRYRLELKSFDQALTVFKSGDAEILAGIYYHPSRLDLGRFSNSILTVKDQLYTLENNQDIVSIPNLQGKRLAIVKSYLSISLLEKQYPNINIVKTANLSESMDLLLSNRVDAVLEGEMYAEHYLRENRISGVKAIPQNTIAALSLRLLTQNKDEELASVLSKLQKRMSLSSDGTLVDALLPAKPELADSKSGGLVQSIILLVALLAIFTSLSFILHRLSRGESSKFGFFSRQFEQLLIMIVSIFSVLIFLTSAYILDKHKKEVLARNDGILKQRLLAAESNINWQFDLYFRILGHEFQQRELLSAIVNLTKKELSQADRVGYEKVIREFWSAYEYFSKKDHRQLLRPTGEHLIGSSRGQKSLISQRFPIYFHTALQGTTLTQAVTHCGSDASVYKGCILVFKPIFDGDNRVVAIVVDQLQLDMHFKDRLADLNRQAEGKVYPANWQGELLGDTFYDDHQSLAAFERHYNPFPALLHKKQNSELVRTEKAQSFINYSGVPSIGLFSWNGRYNYGLIAELPEDEAMAPYSRLFYSIVVLVALVFSFAIPSIIFTLRMGRKANESLKMSRDKLSELVEQRTNELSLLEQRSRLILSSIAQGLLGMDEDFNIVYCNRAAADLLRCSEDSIVDSNFLDLLGSDREEFANTIQSNGFYRSESCYLLRKGAELFAAELNGQTIVDEGQYRGCVVLFNDISERLQLNNELQDAKNKAEQASVAKGQFLANMSHEIRTPMNAVIGMTYLALQTNLDFKQRNYIQKARISAQSMLGVINDILDFSKIEAGKLKVESKKFDLESVFQNSLESVALEADRKGLEICLLLDPSIPRTVIGDPLRLSQIIMNLANNAVKFTERGSVCVEVRLKSLQDNEVLLETVVRDSGIGLSNEQSEGLFESFSQADSSTTRKYGGSGLGLAISKRLCDLMGGEIWFDSQLGEGSNFYFTSKFLCQNSSETVSSFNIVEHVENVLLLGDREKTNNSVARMLKNISVKVHAAKSVADLESSKLGALPSIVLMDVDHSAGVASLCRELGSKYAESQQVHWIFLCGSNIEDVDQELMRCENVERYLCVNKPLSYSRLKHALSWNFSRASGYTKHQDADASQELAYSSLKGARVLLVEDNDINLELACDLLESHGIEVVSARTGQEALDRLDQFSFDAVLMDCQMPIMDGYQATQRIRENPSYSDLPILAMTANVLLSDREKAFESGMNDFIPKPIDVALLFEKLSEWISSSSTDSNYIQSPTADEQMSLDLGQLGLLDLSSYIDAEAGLAICQGKQELYLSLLRKFVSGQSDLLARYKDLASQVDLDAAINLAHSLKGASANLAINSVNEKAKNFERSLKEEGFSDTAIALCEDIESDLRKIQNSLPAREDHKTGSKRRLSIAEGKTTLRRLIRLAEEDDASAIDLFLELTDFMEKSEELREYSKPIEASLSEYDFDKASLLLNKALTTLERTYEFE